MEPCYHIVLNLQGEGGSITHGSVIAKYDGTRQGFKIAAAERTRMEAKFHAEQGTHTDDGRAVIFEVEMW